MPGATLRATLQPKGGSQGEEEGSIQPRGCCCLTAAACCWGLPSINHSQRSLRYLPQLPGSSLLLAGRLQGGCRGVRARQGGEQ